MLGKLASWKTTAGGIVVFLALFFDQIGRGLDDDPTTKPDWNQIVAAAGVLWLGVTARDSNVSSEKAGAK